MNKDQKKYLKLKLDQAVVSKLNEFTKDRPIGASNEDKEKALKLSGLSIVSRGWSDPLQHLELPATKEQKQNKKDIEEYQKKIATFKNGAIDSIELGDDVDALAILKSFTEQLASL